MLKSTLFKSSDTYQGDAWISLVDVSGGKKSFNTSITIDFNDLIYVLGVDQASSNFAYILNYNSEGDILHQKRISSNYLNSICVSPNNYLYTIYGNGLQTDFLKINFLNNKILSQKILKYSNNWDDKLNHRKVIASYDGYVYLCGKIDIDEKSEFGNDFFITKMNNNGDILWNKRYKNTNTDSLHSLLTDKNGNIYIGGQSSTFNTNVDEAYRNFNAFTAKINPNGEIVWKKIFNVEKYSNITFNESYIAIDFNNFIYIHPSVSYKDKLFLVKCDNSGNTLWKKHFKVPNNAGFRYSYSSIITSKDFIYIYGECDNGWFFIKCDNDGNVLNSKILSISNSDDSTIYLYDVCSSYSGTVYITGSYRYSSNNNKKGLLIKITDDLMEKEELTKFGIFTFQPINMISEDTTNLVEVDYPFTPVNITLLEESSSYTIKNTSISNNILYTES